MKIMMKKFLTALLGAVPVLMMSAFALTVDLFRGGLSVLDSVLLIGVGLALIGVLLLCIAFLKPVKAVPDEEWEEVLPETEVAAPVADAAEEVAAEEPSVEQAEEPEVETEAETSEEPEAEISEEAAAEEDAEEAEAEEVPAAADAEEAAEEEVAEKVYPTLTLTGINNGEFMILPLKESVSLGRRPANDLVFSDTTISGVHCGITVEEDDKVYLCDKDSTNGTFVNARRIAEKTELHKGDVLALGQLEFRVGL